MTEEIIILVKICTKCGLEKPHCEFYKDNQKKDKLDSSCKCCRSFTNLQWRVDNPEKIKECGSKWRAENPERKRESNLKYYEENKEQVLATNKKWRDVNPEKVKEYHEKWNAANPEKVKLIKSTWNKKNPNYNRDKCDKDALYKLKGNIRKLIYKAITRGGYTKDQHAYIYLGCEYEEFMINIESQFTEGMSWDNYGKWHLDHIYPASRAVDEEHLIALNHYTNFQPLWAEDNIRKGNKLPEELFNINTCID